MSESHTISALRVIIDMLYVCVADLPSRDINQNLNIIVLCTKR